MRVAIAADHGGYRLKEEVKRELEAMGIPYQDFGTDSPESVDYPDYALPVAKGVASGEFDRGILICGTGIGMSIAANKVRGIRCALVHDVFSARATREHNDSNVLAMGERIIGPGLAREIVRTWLTTEYAGGRHQRRIDKIARMEAQEELGDDHGPGCGRS
ncbi:MAG: ribose 5-phosphate isomerase B [Bacillaceae bacterium G1]|nr:ribose 5-phosphate isomerase B [Bacillota bacterium]OJF16945.1 MAG: ribose 5-phosphate isomerase B [Bacillaceae bacterium G1]